MFTVAAKMLRIKLKEPGSFQLGYRPLVAGTRVAENNSIVARSNCQIGHTRFQISHIQQYIAAACTVISSLQRRGGPPGLVSRTNFD